MHKGMPLCTSCRGQVSPPTMWVTRFGRRCLYPPTHLSPVSLPFRAGASITVSSQGEFKNCLPNSGRYTFSCMFCSPQVLVFSILCSAFIFVAELVGFGIAKERDLTNMVIYVKSKSPNLPWLLLDFGLKPRLPTKSLQQSSGPAGHPFLSGAFKHCTLHTLTKQLLFCKLRGTATLLLDQRARLKQDLAALWSIDYGFDLETAARTHWAPPISSPAFSHRLARGPHSALLQVFFFVSAVEIIAYIQFHSGFSVAIHFF